MIDEAIARVTSPAMIRDYIALIGTPVGATDAVFAGDVVQKCRYSTHRTRSVIRDVDFTTSIEYPAAGGQAGRAGFCRVMLCERFTSDGDSGAAVLIQRSVIQPYFSPPFYRARAHVHAEAEPIQAPKSERTCASPKRAVFTGAMYGEKGESTQSCVLRTKLDGPFATWSQTNAQVECAHRRARHCQSSRGVAKGEIERVWRPSDYSAHDKITRPATRPGFSTICEDEPHSRAVADCVRELRLRGRRRDENGQVSKREHPWHLHTS